MKIEKIHDGAIVYVIEDYDTNQKVIYKIGKTDNMNKRIKIYNTHSIHNKSCALYRNTMSIIVRNKLCFFLSRNMFKKYVI